MPNAQKQIESLLAELIADGQERGLQVAAYLRGELVVNACAGVMDIETGRLVEETTLFPVFSTSKGITTTIIHLLVEQGKLAYSTRVAEVWPEYGCRGKEAITVQQVLAHTSGVPHLPAEIGYSELCDWTAFSSALARVAPLSAPGTKMEYHAISYGNILGEVARRIDGRPFPQILRELIAQPLGLEGLYIGLPDSEMSRVAWLENLEPVIPELDPAVPQSIPLWLWPLHAMMNRPDARRACLPASNGIMTAAAIARHYAALLPGGVDGVELLPPARMRLATQRQYPDGWAGEELPLRALLGYMYGGPETDMGGSTACLGTGGFGGSLGFADPECGLAVGVTKNLFNSYGNTQRIVQTLREALGV